MALLRPLLQLYRDAFRGISADVWLFSTVAFINRTGTMVLPFLVLYLTAERDFSTGYAGLMLSLYGIGSTLGTLAGGWLSDRIDPVRFQIASLTAAGGLFTLLGLLRDATAIALCILAVSFAVESFRPANSLTLARLSAADGKIQAFALRRLALNFGMTFGAAIGGFVAARSYAWIFPVDGATCLLATVPLWLWLRRRGGSSATSVVTAETTIAPNNRRTPLRDRPFLVLIGLTALLAIILFQLWSSYPLALTDRYGLEEDRIGLLMAINTLLIVALEMALAQLLKRRSPLRVAAAGALFLGVGVGLTAWGSTFAFAAAAVVVWTVGEMLCFPFLEGFVAQRAEGPRAGRYMGLFASTFSFAFILAPAIGTMVFERWGDAVLWHGCTVAGVLLCLAFLALARRIAAGPAGPELTTPTAAAAGQ
ncbi:MAG: MFS transporter [Acidobacteriota bacterium]